MITFALIATIMVVAALACIVVPLGRNASHGGPTAADVNLNVLQTQRRELDQDLLRGAIGAEQYSIARRELEERALRDVGVDSRSRDPSSPTPAWMIAVIAVALPVATIGLYRAIGTPIALDPVMMEMAATFVAPHQDPDRLAAQLAAKMREHPALESAESDAARESQAQVGGTVSLAPALQNRVAPDDVVFVIARPASGERTPLAVQRAQVRDLPLRFLLDDSLAMAAQRKLSDHPNVLIVARVARNGSPMPISGDLEGASRVVPLGDRAVAVVIDRSVP